MPSTHGHGLVSAIAIQPHAATPAPAVAAKLIAAVDSPWTYSFYSQGFDGVPARILLGGQVSPTAGPADCTPAGSCACATNWATITIDPYPGTNCVFHDDPGCVTDSVLVIPTIFGRALLNLYFTCSSSISTTLKVVLEISINGGPFVDITTAPGYLACASD